MKGLIEEIGNAFDKIFTSDEQRMQAQAMLNELEQRPELVQNIMQNLINLNDSKSNSKLQSGWRPALGWVCVAGLVIAFIFNPIVTWVVNGFPKEGILVPEDIILELVLALLGLATLRTAERFKGVDKK